MLRKLAAYTLVSVLPLLPSTALSQPYASCTKGNALAYEMLARATEQYQVALGPNLNRADFSPSTAEAVTKFANARTELYRQLEEFIAEAEDFAWAIRECERESSR